MSDRTPTPPLSALLVWLLFDEGLSVRRSIGFAIAAAIFYVLTGFLTEEEFIEWGWRFPFFAALAVNVVSLFARVRLINSDEVQAVVRPKAQRPMYVPRKKNPLKNKALMLKLNPAALIAKPTGTEKRDKKKPSKEVKAIGKKFYKEMSA